MAPGPALSTQKLGCEPVSLPALSLSGHWPAFRRRSANHTPHERLAAPGCISSSIVPSSSEEELPCWGACWFALSGKAAPGTLNRELQGGALSGSGLGGLSQEHGTCPPRPRTHQSMMLVDSAAEKPRTLKFISVAVHSARPPMTGMRERLTSSPKRTKQRPGCGWSVQRRRLSRGHSRSLSAGEWWTFA